MPATTWLARDDRLVRGVARTSCRMAASSANGAMENERVRGEFVHDADGRKYRPAVPGGDELLLHSSGVVSTEMVMTTLARAAASSTKVRSAFPRTGTTRGGRQSHRSQ